MFYHNPDRIVRLRGSDQTLKDKSEIQNSTQITPMGVRVTVDEPVFTSPGRLWAKRSYSQIDKRFADGSYTYSFSEATVIQITDTDGSTTDSEVEEDAENTQQEPGKTAYQAALEGGFVGTEQEFNESLNNVTLDKQELARLNEQIQTLDTNVKNNAATEAEEPVYGYFFFDHAGKKKQVYRRTFRGNAPTTVDGSGAWRLFSTFNPKHLAIKAEGYIAYTSSGQCREINTIATLESTHGYWGVTVLFDAQHTAGRPYCVTLYYVYED